MRSSSIPYPIQFIWQKHPALSLVPVSLGWIPLSQPPFLHLLRPRLVVTRLVRWLPRYYWTVRPPVSVHHCFTPSGFSMQTFLRPDTGPKTHPGGLNTGLFKDAYHAPVSVNNPPKAGRKPRIIKKTIFSTFIIRDAGGAPWASPWHHLVSPIRFANGGI